MPRISKHRHTDSPSGENPLYGIVFMICMAICFSVLDAAAKYISRELPLFMVLWGRYLFHFIFVSLLFFRGAAGSMVHTQSITLQVLRSLLIFCAGVAFWRALMFLPLADCFAIAFSSPLLVTALSVPILGEHVGWHRWGTVVVGLVGVLIIMRPGMGVFHWAAILPLVAAFFYAACQITTRMLGHCDHPLTTLFYTGICGLVLSSIAVVFVWVPPTLRQWSILVLLGFLGAVGHYFMINAFKYAPVSMLAPFDYTTLVWAALLGFFLFGDLPDIWTVSGTLVIITSGLYLIRREKRPVAA